MVWAKFEFARRLGDDWRGLADVLEVPAHVQQTFSQGYEGRAIWTLLERQHRLDALPPALRLSGESTWPRS